jgi:hypothetical protein
MRLVKYVPHPLFYAETTRHLPDHLVWPVTLSQAERTGKVAHKQWLLLDGSKESLVNCLLVRSAAARWLLLLFKELISLQTSFENQIPLAFLLA